MVRDGSIGPDRDGEDSGPSLAQFVLIIGFIVVIAGLALLFMGGQIAPILSDVSCCV